VFCHTIMGGLLTRKMQGIEYELEDVQSFLTLVEKSERLIHLQISTPMEIQGRRRNSDAMSDPLSVVASAAGIITLSPQVP
jgi:hypothetical protein